MEFVSAIYLLCIIVFVILVWTISHRYLTYVLSVFGFTFIFINAPIAGIVLICETIICYFVSNQRKFFSWIYAILLIILLSIAFLLFKYYAQTKFIELPLGISYFTFRLIHYLQDNYRNRIRKHSFIEFLAYISFFPTFLVGPINRFPEFITNLRRRTWDYKAFSKGLERVFYGYAQLIVIGNFMINSLFRDWIFGIIHDETDFLALFLRSVLLWLDLYIRFSAYSSIAIGISQMAGFNIPENFNYPFLSTNIREFWQRWHITLTGWCREYIFVPVAAITRKPFLSIGATMIAIGVWHELSLRYILWGIYHSLGIIIYDRWSKMKFFKVPQNKIFLYTRKITGVLLTVIFVVLSFPVTNIVMNYLNELCK